MKVLFWFSSGYFQNGDRVRGKPTSFVFFFKTTTAWFTLKCDELWS